MKEPDKATFRYFIPLLYQNEIGARPLERSEKTLHVRSNILLDVLDDGCYRAFWALIALTVAASTEAALSARSTIC
jgi:hypothetical protein